MAPKHPPAETADQVFYVARQVRLRGGRAHESSDGVALVSPDGLRCAQVRIKSGLVSSISKQDRLETIGSDESTWTISGGFTQLSDAEYWVTDIAVGLGDAAHPSPVDWAAFHEQAPATEGDLEELAADVAEVVKHHGEVEAELARMIEMASATGEVLDAFSTEVELVGQLVGTLGTDLETLAQRCESVIELVRESTALAAAQQVQLDMLSARVDALTAT